MYGGARSPWEGNNSGHGPRGVFPVEKPIFWLFCEKMKKETKQVATVAFVRLSLVFRIDFFRLCPNPKILPEWQWQWDSCPLFSVGWHELPFWQWLCSIRCSHPRQMCAASWWWYPATENSMITQSVILTKKLWINVWCMFNVWCLIPFAKVR